MLNRGLQQCDKLIIDKPNLTDRFIRRIISNHIIEGQIIKEIWVREDSGELILFYKKRTVDITINPRWQRIGSH